MKLENIRMNKVIATSYDASKGIYLPARRITGSLSLDALAVIGIIADGDVNEYGFRHCMLPADWKPVAATESDMQLRIEDGQGRLRARVFYKPGSQGGGGSLELCPRFTTRFASNNTVQWGEVYDGNEMIHHTASGPKTVDKMGYTAASQPQYKEADPDNKNPLAYWN
jgi:hypothetical protein